MATQRISALTAAVAAATTDQIPIENAANETKKVTAAQLAALIHADMEAADVNTALGYTAANAATLATVSGVADGAAAAAAAAQADADTAQSTANTGVANAATAQAAADAAQATADDATIGADLASLVGFAAMWNGSQPTTLGFTRDGANLATSLTINNLAVPVTRTSGKVTALGGLTSAPAFTRATAANNPETGAAAASGAVRYARGRNLLSKNQSDVEVNLTGIGGWSGGEVITRDTSLAWQGSACIKCVAPDSAANKGISVTANVSDGVEYTFSAYVQGTGTVIARHSDAATGSSAPVTLNLVAWQRVSIAATATKGGVDAPGITTDVAQAITFYVDGLMFERGGAATDWVVGGDNAILIERAATNLLPSGAENFNTDTWSLYLGAGLVRTTGQADPFGGTNAVRLELTGGSSDLKYYTGSGTAASGTLYSTSLLVRVNSGADCHVQNNPFSETVVVTSADGWVEVTLDGAPGNDLSSLQLLLRAPTAGDDLDITVMWPQIEVGDHCTSYIAPGATRNAEGLAISMPKNIVGSPAAVGTILVKFKIDTAGTDIRALVDLAGTGPTGAILYLTAGQKVTFQCMGQTPTTTTSVTPGPFHAAAGKFNSDGFKVFLDGALESTIAGTPAVVAPSDLLYVGSISNVVNWLDGAVDEIAIFRSDLTDAEVEALCAVDADWSDADFHLPFAGTLAYDARTLSIAYTGDYVTSIERELVTYP